MESRGHVSCDVLSTMTSEGSPHTRMKLDVCRVVPSWGRHCVWAVPKESGFAFGQVAFFNISSKMSFYITLPITPAGKRNVSVLEGWDGGVGGTSNAHSTGLAQAQSPFHS